MSFKKLTVEDQLKEERKKRLAILAEKEELEETLVESLVDLDFRQTMSELGL